MRKALIVLIVVLTFSAVSSKVINKKSQLEMQPLESNPILKNSQTEKIDSSSKPYSSERFSSRKKVINSSTQNQNVLLSKSKAIERRKDSVIGDMIIGSILFFAGFPCLWYNEKGYAYTKTFIRKYKKICKNVKSSLEVDPNNEDKLICIQGDTSTEDIVVDTAFAMRVNNSIKLSRVCEMYQWVEHRHSRRISADYDEVYYTYSKEWRKEFICSQNYHDQQHPNLQGNWVYNQEQLFAPNVTYGAFKLSESQKKQCEKQEVVPFTMEALENVAQQGRYNITHNALARPDQNLSVTADSSQINAPPPPPNPMEDVKQSQPVPTQHYEGSKVLVVQDDYLYIRHHSQDTSIGDFRVKFYKTPCGEITVVGKQQLDTIETFSPEEENPKKKNLEESGGCCACCGVVCKACEEINAPISEINWVVEEKCKKKKIFAKKLSDYETKTWIMRLIGFCCFWFGVYLMLSPVYYLMYAFPLLGRYLGTLGEWICGFIGFVIAIPLTILTISIAWLFYRKEIGIPLLCVALILIGYFSFSYAKDYEGEQPEKVKF